MKPNKIRRSYMLEIELYEKLKAESEKTGLTMTKIIERALMKALKR